MLMKRWLLVLVLLAVFSGVLYGLGLPPFHKQATEETPLGRQRSRALAVSVGEVHLGAVVDNINAVGSLLASRSVSVAPKINGRVERVLVNVGDRVTKGQTLAQLDPREHDEEVKEAAAALKVSEATLKGKQAELQDIRRKLERAKLLFEKNFISRQELDTLEADRAEAAAQVELARAQIVEMKARLAKMKLQLEETRVEAPFSGYIEKRFVDPGALVNSGTPIARIVDIARVKVIVPVVEKDYPKISIGQVVVVAVDAYPGSRFQGRVVRLTPVLSQETRTGEVEIEVDNSTGLLKPGMFARVEIAIGKHREVLLVPEGALVKTAQGHGVFRVVTGRSKDPKAELIPVKIGTTRAGQAEIQGNLKAGDRVVTLGSSLLKDGQSIRITGEKATRKRKQGA